MVAAWLTPVDHPGSLLSGRVRYVSEIFEETSVELNIPIVFGSTHFNVAVRSKVVIAVQFIEEQVDIAADAQYE